jgi:hypothetical protein
VGFLLFSGKFYGVKRQKKRLSLEQEKKSSPKIIRSRFNMMAEGLIPQEAFENLQEKHVKIFLTEPDPKKWPSELSHLKKYVPEDTVA